MGVDDNVDAALAVQQHLTRTVPGNGCKAHHLQHLAQCLRLGRQVFNELNTVKPQRVGKVVDGFAVVCKFSHKLHPLIKQSIHRRGAEMPSNSHPSNSHSNMPTTQKQTLDVRICQQIRRFFVQHQLA